MMVMRLKMSMKAQSMKVVYLRICDQNEGDEGDECENDKGGVCDKDEDGGILMMGVMTMQLRGIVKVMSDHND